MLFEKVSEIYFNPFDTIKEIINKITNNFKGTCEIHDLLNYEKTELQENLVVMNLSS